MKTILKSAILTSAAILFFMADMSPQPSRMPPGLQLPLGVQLVSDAHAIYGRQRRTRRRGLAVGYAAGTSAAAASSASVASTSQQQAAPAQQQPAAPPPPTYGPLPLGTVVPQLPAGCTATTAGGVEYYHCGENYFRAAFQGNTLVYVTAKP